MVCEHAFFGMETLKMYVLIINVEYDSKDTKKK